MRRGLDPGAEPHYWFVELVEHVCHTDDKENHQKSGAGGGVQREQNGRLWGKNIHRTIGTFSIWQISEGVIHFSLQHICSMTD